MANRNEKEASRKRILSTCVRLFLEQGFKHTRGGDGDSADAGRAEREPASNLRGGVHAAGKFGNHPQDDGRDAAPYFRRVYAWVQCERFL